MTGPRVSLKRARELLAERGDQVDQSALSRYVSKYADALDPAREGRETVVDFETLAKHRSENNINHRAAPAAGAKSAQHGRAHEAALNIRAQRQMRELELAQQLGRLLPIDETRRAAADCAIRLRRSVERMHVQAEDVADGLARDGSAFAGTLVAAIRADPAGARSFFKALSRDHLGELARMATALDDAAPSAMAAE